MAAEKEYMTYEERWDLAQAVKELTVDEQRHIHLILTENDPDSLKDCEDDPDYAISSFELMKPQTLRKLEGYIASCRVNTQSEIKENNPAEEKSEESKEEIKEKSKEESEEKYSLLTSTPKKFSSSEDSEVTPEKAKSPSIKTRLRKRRNSLRL